MAFGSRAKPGLEDDWRAVGLLARPGGRPRSPQTAAATNVPRVPKRASVGT
jgi:hypothetical protein